MTTGFFITDAVGRIAATNSETTPTPLMGIPFLIPDAADADYDVVMDVKFEVIDVVVRKDGAGTGNTITVKSTAAVITDVIAAAVDKAVTHAGTINVLNNTVPALGVLRVSAHKAAGSMACLVTVLGFPRP